VSTLSNSSQRRLIPIDLLSKISIILDEPYFVRSFSRQCLISVRVPAQSYSISLIFVYSHLISFCWS
jgi:hypothetical protein